MSSFNQSAFNSFVIQNSVVGFFEKPLTLKSGRQSNWYFNWRKVSNDAFLMDSLSDFVFQFVSGLVAAKSIEAPDTLYGVPEGATKLGVLTQFKWAKNSGRFAAGSHSLAMGRGSAKTHGHPEDRFFVGMPRGKTLVIEDVTTTGGSLLTTIDQLVEAGVEIVAAIGLTNRMERRDDGKSVAEAIAEKDSAGKKLKYFQMSSAIDLLPEVARVNNPGAEILRSIQEEFERYGTQPLKLV